MRSAPAPVLTPPSWISRCATGATAQQFPAVAIDHQGHRGPASPSGPDPAHVGGPALIQCLGHRGQGLDPGPEAYRALSHLPALYLEDALHRVLVEPQQMRHRSIAEGWVLLDHGLDRRHQSILQLWRSLELDHQCDLFSNPLPNEKITCCYSLKPMTPHLEVRLIHLKIES